MKFTLAPLVSLLFGASYLITNAAAYSYNDYNELDARYQVDDGGFGLAARETVDVPFQPSLRAFLDEAVAAHRRSMSEYEHLEAREIISVTARVVISDKEKRNPKFTFNVDPAQKKLREFTPMMQPKVPQEIKLSDYTPWLGGKLLVGGWKTLKDLEVKNGATIDYILHVPKP
ncbi:hypothetical protein DFP72DRAFT_1043900 [Ephemerocybe angulata]|uniref:Uncharacterized protein n=1 Tax=Ephemerocybe angulata TaxID=980116 RepID=A0A8H6HNA3_9AGAR|nr:hypothetical protein DFP72DRAFT_1173034 [Tulosesus angulatus]KAF6757851.1 hypothetical protein DFP72DRAFT_1043900 [Tulosesus angulatus]